MSRTKETFVIDGILEPLSRCFDAESARRLIEFEIPPEIQDRVDVLAARAGEGMLTGDEREEYETYINISDLLSTLQLKARSRLTGNGAS